MEAAGHHHHHHQPYGSMSEEDGSTDAIRPHYNTGPNQDPSMSGNYYQSYNEKALPMLPQLPPDNTPPSQLPPQYTFPPRQPQGDAVAAALPRRRRRPLVLLLLLVAALVVAIAIAVGVGVGITNRNKANSTQADAVPASSSSALPTPTQTPTSPSIAPAATNPAPSTVSGGGGGGGSGANNGSCPDAADTEYTLAGGQKFLLICGYDYSGTGEAADIANTQVTSVLECMETCANQTGCTGAGWGVLGGDVGDMHTCWMKSQLNQSHAATSNWNFVLMLAGDENTSNPTDTTGVTR